MILKVSSEMLIELYQMRGTGECYGVEWTLR